MFHYFLPRYLQSRGCQEGAGWRGQLSLPEMVLSHILRIWPRTATGAPGAPVSPLWQHMKKAVLLSLLSREGSKSFLISSLSACFLSSFKMSLCLVYSCQSFCLDSKHWSVWETGCNCQGRLLRRQQSGEDGLFPLVRNTLSGWEIITLANKFHLQLFSLKIGCLFCCPSSDIYLCKGDVTKMSG